MSSPAKKKPTNLSQSFLKGFGIGAIILACFIFYRLLGDSAKQEVKFRLRTFTEPAQLTPINPDFSIIIDKIGASSAVIKNVDPYNSRTYQLALRDGVAHALGTALPGEGGNIFLFAHSSADLLTAERYNSIFYLIHHLETDDLIKLWYDGREHDYSVTSKRIVGSSDTSYLTAHPKSEQLTLMTCWPPGTNFKRLIVIAKSI